MKWLFFAFALTLSACTYANPITLARVMAMNPLIADPSDIAVFFDVPDGYDVKKDSVLFIVFGAKNKGEAEERHEFVLVPASHLNLRGFELSTADQNRLLAVQTKFRIWKADPSLDAGGGMSVFGQPCKKSEFVTLDGTISMFVRLKPGQDPLPLVRNAPLSSFSEQSDIDALPLCQ